MRALVTTSLLLLFPLASGCGSRVVTGTAFDCGDGTGVDALFVCDGFEDCFNGADEAFCYSNWTCYSGVELVNPLVLCDGIEDCPDGSDEGYCDASFYSVYVCDDDRFDVDVDFVCDGVMDCPDGSDEAYCAYSFLCDDLTHAVFPDYVCDGVVDCPDSTDEIYCY